MHIECFPNKGRKYLRLANDVNVKDASGKFKTKKKVVFNIGFMDNFDDGQPEYLQRLRKSFRDGNPLIESLKPFVEDRKEEEKITLTFTNGAEESLGHPRLVSHLLIEKYLDELGLTGWMKVRKHHGKMKFDLLGFFRLLICGRIISPDSKMATFHQNEDYYGEILEKGSNPYNIYDTLDFIWERKDGIISAIHRSMVAKFGRTTKLIFYDVTNFFFEIDEPDGDVEDEDGNVLKKGLRKKGVSKEERKLPIVQVGLFMDEQGVPVGIAIFPGNTLDHQTVAKACRKTVDTLDTGRFVFVGDKGMNSGAAIIHLLSCGNGYLISRSTCKLAREMKDWILDEHGYNRISTKLRRKSIVTKRTVQNCVTGEKREVTEKNVVYWSKEYYDRQDHERKDFTKFLKELSERPESFRITATQYKTIRKYLGREVVNIKTGELIKASSIKPLLDLAKAREKDEMMGYYLIATSELEKSDQEVVDTYHELSRIEDQFRVMKGTLETRPIYVRTEEHIYAHLLCCMIALVIIRLIQRKILLLEKPGRKSGKKKLWEMGLSSDRIQKALAKWMVDRMPLDYFRFCNTDDKDLGLILKAHGITIERKLYRRGDLRTIRNEAKVI